MQHASPSNSFLSEFADDDDDSKFRFATFGKHSEGEVSNFFRPIIFRQNEQHNQNTLL